MDREVLQQTLIVLLIESDRGSQRAQTAVVEFVEAAPDEAGYWAFAEADFTLGLEYLTGSQRVGVDYALARAHLAEACAVGFPPWNSDRLKVIEKARDHLDGEAKLVFDSQIVIS